MRPDCSFALTLFPDFAATSKSERVFSLLSLATRIRTTTAPQKSTWPWLKLAQFGDQRTAKGSLRHDGNMLAISGIEADYDGEAMPFDEARQVLEKQGIESLIYTSPSHTEDKPRLRVLCPGSQQEPPHRRNHYLGRLNGLFRGVFSGESWTLSQSYYFGSIDRNPLHRVAVIEGHPIDQHDDLDPIWLGKSGTSTNPDRTDKLAGKDSRDDAELIRCVVTGEHFHVELCALAARYIGRNISSDTVEDLLRGIMLSHPEGTRNERWQDRYDSISELVASARRKYREGSEKQPDPRRKDIARAAFAMLRQRKTAAEIVTELHRLHQQHSQPLPADMVNTTAIWCARQYTQRHDA
jgi:hypothetical protein